MTVPYNVIEVFTSEETRWKGRPVADAIIDVLRNARIAARCFVARGQAGYYESGELASAKLEVLASNLPLKIEVILPAPELERVLPKITEIVTDGIVVVEEMQVHSHRSRYRLIPRQLRVRDIMATPAVSVRLDTPVSDVVRRLLEADQQHRF
jgi:PII-like signaling protein